MSLFLNLEHPHSLITSSSSYNVRLPTHYSAHADTLANRAGAKHQGHADVHRL